ncbi:MAG TPA: Hsp20/alpha crystallin family protein [Streptosporangiaceae bacterium]|nr:Hsp20/alpha crystallin family protein [Streptosporangiaceae bacterium]
MPGGSLLRFSSSQTFRVEDYTKDGNYVIRAELPGLDPDKDIDVTVDDGTMTIHAERREEERKSRRSEFRYGSLTRSVRLPAKVDAKDVKARYEKRQPRSQRPGAGGQGGGNPDRDRESGLTPPHWPSGGPTFLAPGPGGSVRSSATRSWCSRASPRSRPGWQP